MSVKRKKCNVILLQTNQEKTKNSICLIKNKYLKQINNWFHEFKANNKELRGEYNFGTKQNYLQSEVIPHHLYITNDDKIKLNDWYICQSSMYPKQCVKCNSNKHSEWVEDYLGNQDQLKFSKKIIATTDLEIAIKKGEYNIGEIRRKVMIPTETILLPQPSKSFIKKFIVEYNNQNVISDIDVEYDWAEDTSKAYTEKGQPVIEFPKTDKNNEITIFPIKNTWNKKEVIDLFNKLQFEINTFFEETCIGTPFLQEFLKNNL